MTDIEKAEQAWNEKAALSAESMSSDYLIGISDFKSSLQREIEKSILKTKLDSSYSPAYKEAKINGLRESLEKLNTVEP